MSKRDLIVRQLKSSNVLHLILGLQMKYELDQAKELSAQIATAIRDAIVNGQLIVNQRLPSESELCEQLEVSRHNVREALKRLAAQNLVRTQRGATGGAFVNKLSFEDAYTVQDVVVGGDDLASRLSCACGVTNKDSFFNFLDKIFEWKISIIRCFHSFIVCIKFGGG